MKYHLDIVILGLPKMLPNMSSKSWRAVHFEKMKWKNIVMNEIILHKLKPKMPIEKCKLILTRFSSKQSDFDNRVASFKAVVDGLITVGIMIDDKDSVIVERHYPWIKESNRHRQRIRIEIEEL
jgi:Holliday junction resolvase RusA-like endonuclease